MTLSGFFRSSRCCWASPPGGSRSDLTAAAPPAPFRGELFRGEDLGVFCDVAAAAARVLRISCASALMRQAISCVPLP